jgi:hypothetical protein
MASENFWLVEYQHADPIGFWFLTYTAVSKSLAAKALLPSAFKASAMSDVFWQKLDQWDSI